MSDSTLPPTPGNGDRDKFAVRRLLREMTNGENELARRLQAFDATERDAKHKIESHSRAEHWGREPERPWAWRTAAPDPEGPKRVSWRALRRGADVFSADGLRVGAVEHVLADAESDIFDGVVIDTRLGPGGLRVVDAAQIALIFEHRIVLTVSKAGVHDLPAPPENPGVLKRLLRKGRQRVSGR